MKNISLSKIFILLGDIGGHRERYLRCERVSTWLREAQKAVAAVGTALSQILASSKIAV